MSDPYGMQSHILIQFQDSYGTTKVDSLNAVPYISESLSEKIEQITEASNYGRFAESPYHKGLEMIEGDIVMEAHPISMGWLMRAGFGQCVTTSDTGVQRHVMVPLNTNDWDPRAALPPFNTEVNFHTGSAALFSDLLVNNLTFEIANGELMKMTAGIIGGNVKFRAASTPTFPTGTPFLWRQTSASYNGWDLDFIKDLSITINNNLEVRHTMNGSATPYSIKRTGPFEVDISGTVEFLNHSLWLAYRDQDEVALTVSFVGAETPEKLEFIIPKMRILEFSPQIGGPGLVEVGFTAKAIYDTTSSLPIHATLTNTQETYA